MHQLQEATLELRSGEGRRPVESNGVSETASSRVSLHSLKERVDRDEIEQPELFGALEDAIETPGGKACR